MLGFLFRDALDQIIVGENDLNLDELISSPTHRRHPFVM
jgi:hypothetical protein